MFGLSFGSNSTSSTSNTTGTKTETGTQTGSTDSTSGTTTSSNQATQNADSKTGSSSSTQAGTTNSAGSATQAQQTTSQTLDDKTLGGLQGAVASLLGKIADPNSGQGVVNAGLGVLGQFDPAAYVSSTLRAAQSTSDSSVKEALGGIFDAIGGKNNSAAALLSGRLNDQAAANIAGVGAQATKDANAVVQGNVATGTAAAASQGNLLTNLLQVLKGGTTTGTGNTATTTAETGATSNTGSTTTAESGASTSDTQATQVQDVITALNQLLNTSDTTVADEKTTTKGKSTGVGISGGF